MIKTTKQTKL